MRKSSANGTKGQTDWNAINWWQVNRRVRNLRQRIFRACRGQLLGLLGKWQYFPRPQAPVPLERDVEEKSQRRNGDVDRAGHQLLLVGEIDLIGSNILAAEQVWRLAEVSGNSDTCCRYESWVLSERLRTCMSSLMRWRSGVMMSSSVRWNGLENSRPILSQLGLLLHI